MSYWSHDILKLYYVIGIEHCLKILNGDLDAIIDSSENWLQALVGYILYVLIDDDQDFNSS